MFVFSIINEFPRFISKKTNTLACLSILLCKVNKISTKHARLSNFLGLLLVQKYENNVKGNKIWIVFLCLPTFS